MHPCFCLAHLRLYEALQQCSPQAVVDNLPGAAQCRFGPALSDAALEIRSVEIIQENTDMFLRESILKPAPLSNTETPPLE